MENREHFGSLTARMKAFREEVLDEKPYVDAERRLIRKIRISPASWQGRLCSKRSWRT